MNYKDMTGKEKQREMQDIVSQLMRMEEKLIKDIALEMGIDRSSLARWLRGDGYMKYYNICRIEDWIHKQFIVEKETGSNG